MVSASHWLAFAVIIGRWQVAVAALAEGVLAGVLWLDYRRDLMAARAAAHPSRRLAPVRDLPH